MLSNFKNHDLQLAAFFSLMRYEVKVLQHAAKIMCSLFGPIELGVSRKWGATRATPLHIIWKWSNYPLSALPQCVSVCALAHRRAVSGQKFASRRRQHVAEPACQGPHVRKRAPPNLTIANHSKSVSLPAGGWRVCDLRQHRFLARLTDSGLESSHVEWTHQLKWRTFSISSNL
jgi:hypothetical protein